MDFSIAVSDHKRRRCVSFALSFGVESCYLGGVERIVHKARDFAEAEAWDAFQHRAMTPEDRMRAAKEIRDRVFPGKNLDIREWHRSQKGQ